MAEHYTEVEEQEATRIEKVLVAGLAGFLLLGGAWVIGAISAQLPRPVLNGYDRGYASYQQEENTSVPIEQELGMGPLQAQTQKLADDLAKRQSAEQNAIARRDKAQKAYEYRREEYRTAMEAGRATAAGRTQFEDARASFDRASAQLKAAEADKARAAQELAEPQRRLDAMQQRAQAIYESRVRMRDALEFSLHFGFAAACLGGAWLLWQTGRRRHWRYQSILTSAFVAAVIQLFFLSLFHCWGYIQEQFTLLGISLVGIVVCVLAIVGLKRWLFSPERLAHARLAGHRCPHCTTPFEPAQEFCWGCGHPLKETCLSCGNERLRFAPHCGHCGAGRETSANPMQREMKSHPAPG